MQYVPEDYTVRCTQAPDISKASVLHSLELAMYNTNCTMDQLRKIIYGHGGFPPNPELLRNTVNSVRKAERAIENLLKEQAQLILAREQEELRLLEEQQQKEEEDQVDLCESEEIEQESMHHVDLPKIHFFYQGPNGERAVDADDVYETYLRNKIRQLKAKDRTEVKLRKAQASAMAETVEHILRNPDRPSTS
jgi:hypothetical protein